MPTLTIDAFISSSVQTLRQADIDTARLDIIVMLEDVLRIDRAQILAHTELKLTNPQLDTLTKMLQRRAKHEPLAYIRNKTEFYNREFYIDHHVLEPRPESETIINVLKAKAQDSELTIIDVGTGSGALAITAQMEIPAARVLGIDNDLGCLTIAKKNAAKYHTRITFLLSDLLAGVSDDSLGNAVLLCNLPYVPDDFHINKAAMHEPKQAIFGGPDGLDVFRRMFRQLLTRTVRPQLILTESLPPQHHELETIAKEAGFVLTLEQNFIQCFKMGYQDSGL